MKKLFLILLAAAMLLSSCSGEEEFFEEQEAEATNVLEAKRTDLPLEDDEIILLCNLLNGKTDVNYDFMLSVAVDSINDKMFDYFGDTIIDFDGDTNRAKQHMQIEETAFETHKDFTQLLTDAAMKPESSHASVSTQKFAIALSKDWISDAYNDIIAENRMQIPNEIDITVDTFKGKTTDGQNEAELIGSFNNLVDSEKKSALDSCVLSAFEKFCLFGGGAIALVGLIMMLSDSGFLGVIAIIAGIGMIINHFSKKKKNDINRKNIENKFEEKRQNGSQIIRATLAEVVDFRAEFAAKDNESEKVLDFLEQISPEQYVRKLSDSNRRIDVSK